MLAGVGGQGILLAGDVLAEAAFFANMEVKKSEIHGLSRRFGSVSCQVSMGRATLSPLRGHGAVDLLLATEANEALRNLPYLKPEGIALVNRLWIATGVHPNEMLLADQQQSLPSKGLLEGVDSPELIWLDATQQVHEHGCPKCLNVYLLGALSRLLPLSKKHWMQALRHRVPEAHLRINLEMFQAGRRATAAYAMGFEYRKDAAGAARS